MKTVVLWIISLFSYTGFEISGAGVLKTTSKAIVKSKNAQALIKNLKLEFKNEIKSN